jgi:nitroreductase
MSFLKNLNWRFATKKFDPEKKVLEKNIKQICKAIQLVPSSYGLQPWHVYVISNPEIKKKMQKLSYMQPQIVDASHVLVFCGRNDVRNELINMEILFRVIIFLIK